jgi:hypothetical protein
MNVNVDLNDFGVIDELRVVHKIPKKPNVSDFLGNTVRRYARESSRLSHRENKMRKSRRVSLGEQWSGSGQRTVIREIKKLIDRPNNSLFLSGTVMGSQQRRVRKESPKSTPQREIAPFLVAPQSHTQPHTRRNK